MRPVPRSDLYSTASDGLALAYGQLFNALLVDGAAHDAVHIDARRVDCVWIKAADLDDFLGLHQRELRCRGHGRVEVARRLPEDQVARGIGLPCLDQGE